MASSKERSAQIPVRLRVKQNCQSCELQALYTCEECEKDLCETCKNKHKQKVKEGKHTIIEIRESFSNSSVCNDHKTREIKHFCKTCDRFICDLCKHGTHSEHYLSTVQDSKQQLASSIGKTELIDIVELNNKLESVKELRKIQNAKSRKTIQTIDERIDKLISLITAIGQKMKTFYHEKYKTDEQKLTRLETSLRESTEGTGRLIKEAKSTLKSGDPIDIIKTSIYFETKAKTLQSWSVPSVTDFIPCTLKEENIQNSIQEMIGKFIDTNNLEDLLCQDIVRENPVESVTTKAYKGAEIITSFDLKSDVGNLCPSIGSKIWVNLSGEQEIKLVSIEGQIQRSISLNFVPNEIIKLSQKEMLLSSPDDSYIYKLTKDLRFKKLVKMAPCLPLGIARTSKNQILVCLVDEWSFDISERSERRVSLLDSSGKTVKEIEFDRFDQRLFKLPHSVAENKDLKICVLDALSDKEGRVCLLTPNGDLKYVYNPSSIETKFYPHALLCDSKSNIIIANSFGNIHLLSIDGQFQRYLLQENDLLECPLSITLNSEGYLWIGCMNGKIHIAEYKV